MHVFRIQCSHRSPILRVAEHHTVKQELVDDVCLLEDVLDFPETCILQEIDSYRKLYTMSYYYVILFLMLKVFDFLF